MAVLHLTEESFDDILNGSSVVLVDFWAEWCGPCRMVGPVIEELAADYEGKAAICKVDVDAEQKLAERFSVMTIPTVILFKDGQIAEKSIGAKPKQAFKEILDRHI